MMSLKSCGCSVPLGERPMWRRMVMEISPISGWLWLLREKKKKDTKHQEH
jgi:hypothetical protein